VSALRQSPSPRPRLRLLAPRAESARRAAPPLSLAGAPYRPGELPVALALQLSEPVAQAMNASAKALRLPVELTIRAGLEAARSLRFLAELAPGLEQTLPAELDAEGARQAPTLTVDARQLIAYAQLLLRGEPASVTRAGREGNVELLIPSGLARAWRLDACARGEALSGWASRLLSAAPCSATAWEAAAALRGAGLAEWIYACALSRNASASASPHSRA
jgi:hypothetical protein